MKCKTKCHDLWLISAAMAIGRTSNTAAQVLLRVASRAGHWKRISITSSSLCSVTIGIADTWSCTAILLAEYYSPLRWRHNDHDGVSNHQPHGCLLKRLFRRKSKKTSKLRVTGLCVGKSPGPVNSPHKGPVTRKMFPFDDVIMRWQPHSELCLYCWGYELLFATKRLR